MTDHQLVEKATARSWCDLLRRIAAACCCVSVFITLSSRSLAQQPPTDPAVAEFVARINHSIRSIAATATDEQTRTLCINVIRTAVNLDAVARTASAGTWTRMTPEQRSSYKTAVERRLARDCIFRNTQHRGQILNLVGVRRGDDGDRLAATQLGAPGEPGRMVIWRLRGEAGRLRAVDVMLDGRSLAITLREEARAILERSNGDIGVLLESMGQ